MSESKQAHTSEGHERVPELMLEKLALGELPEERATALRQRLGGAGEERLAGIERSNAEILREHPPAEVAAAVRRRLARLGDEATPRRSGAGWPLWAPMTVAAAAAVALVWWVGRDGEPGGPDGRPDAPLIAKAEPEVPPTKVEGSEGPETIYLKGDPRLMIDRVADGRPTRMSTGDAVAAGDRLQLAYIANGVQQGVVVSIDGAGVATLHFPASEQGSPTLDQGGRVGLPESYELDAAPGFERFFFVTVDGAEPRLDPATVMAAAKVLAQGQRAEDGALVLPEGWKQQGILLRK